MEEALQRITGHTVAKIHEDFQRDFYLSSAEAVQYGIIDEVLLPREKTRQDIYKQRGVSCLSFFVVFLCHVSSPSALAYYFFILTALLGQINPTRTQQLHKPPKRKIKHLHMTHAPLPSLPSLPSPPLPSPPLPSPKCQLVGGPRMLNDEPDFGTFGGEEQRYGDNKGGGWGGGGGRVAEEEGGANPGAA